MIHVLFIWEAFVIPTSDHGTPFFTLTDENAYAILKEDGTYDLYLYDSFLENVNSLDGYMTSLPVYKKEDLK